MNQDTIQGQWKQLAGSIRARWGKLTNDDLDVAEGNAEYLAGKLQQRYGIARDEGIHFLAAGHHATETFGVQRLGELLRERFGLAHEHVDIRNPI